jgi:hypothetical protein
MLHSITASYLRLRLPGPENTLELEYTQPETGGFTMIAIVTKGVAEDLSVRLAP